MLSLLSGCGTAGPTAVSPPPAPPPPPPPVPAPGLRLLPDAASVVPGQTVQFSAALDGVPVLADQIAWSISDTTLGQVSGAGLLAVTPCFRGGYATVRGVLSRDTTKQATAAVVIVVPAFALVFIYDIRRATDQQPVDLDQVAGTVEVTVLAPALRCHDLVDLQLQITGPAGDTLLPPIHFVDPPPSTNLTGVFTWETAASVNGARVFPDGEYQLHAIRHEIPELRVVSSPISLRVRNQ